jgi:hypothetical protein
MQRDSGSAFGRQGGDGTICERSGIAEELGGEEALGGRAEMTEREFAAIGKLVTVIACVSLIVLIISFLRQTILGG